MLKKTIKFTDLDGQPAEEDAYFNLTKAEAIELNIRNDLEVIGRSRNNNEIMDTFKRILKMSYGRRTSDGKFLKEERDWQTFVASEAYSELFMEIWQNPDYALEFIRGILPAEVAAQMGDQPTQGNQSSIPAHLANHPSMQGHKEQAPNPQNDYRQGQSPTPQPPQGPSGGSDAVGFPSRFENDAEYQEYLAWKRQKETMDQAPPATGVTTPEVPQQLDSTPRDELI